MISDTLQRWTAIIKCLNDGIISGGNLQETIMSSQIKANISKTEILSSCYPRLKRLQDTYRDKLHLCQEFLPKWAYDALLGPIENPVLFFCSSGNNREYIDSLSERIASCDIDGDKLWCVMEEMNHSAVPHMYLVALNFAKRAAKIELSTQVIMIFFKYVLFIMNTDILNASYHGALHTDNVYIHVYYFSVKRCVGGIDVQFKLVVGQFLVAIR